MRARPLSRLLEASDVILGGLAIARILRLLAGIDHSGCPAWVERRTGRRSRVARRGGGGCASAALSGAALGVGRIVRIGGQSRPAQGQKQTCADREGGGDVCHGYHPSQSRASVLASRERTSRRRFGASRPRFRQARQCSARSGSASRDRAKCPLLQLQTCPSRSRGNPPEAASLPKRGNTAAARIIRAGL
jgi:hypothetical protein